MNLSGNTVLITGGATGIGLATADAFLKAGSEVVICGRREGRLLEARKKHPELHIRTCDVANESDCTALAEWVSTSFNNLNILVNNACVQRDIDFTKASAHSRPVRAKSKSTWKRRFFCPGCSSLSWLVRRVWRRVRRPSQRPIRVTQSPLTSRGVELLTMLPLPS